VVHAVGDQWLRRPAPSDLKVIVVDIDRASIDALGTWPWPRETVARLVEAVATGRHPGATPAWRLHHADARHHGWVHFFSATRIRHSIAACRDSARLWQFHDVAGGILKVTSWRPRAAGSDRRRDASSPSLPSGE